MPNIININRDQLQALRQGQVDPRLLLISQTLSRSLDEYSVLSSAARAVRQLEQVNTQRFPGQRIRFLFTVGNPGVFAWELPQPFDKSTIDAACYTKLMLRAVTAVLQPWGIQKEWVQEWVLHDWYQAHFYLARV